MLRMRFGGGTFLVKLDLSRDAHINELMNARVAEELLEHFQARPSLCWLELESRKRPFFRLLIPSIGTGSVAQGLEFNIRLRDLIVKQEATSPGKFAAALRKLADELDGQEKS